MIVRCACERTDGMPLLEQTELFEADTPRKVVLPMSARDTAGWWGIDVSTVRYNVGWVDQQGNRGAHSVKLGPANDNEGERLTRFARQLRGLIDAMLAEPGVPPPAVVFVEQAAALGGRGGSKPIFWYAVATATQVVYERVQAHTGWVPRVETVPSATWKLKAVGSGKIKKPYEKGVKFPLDAYPVWQWAADLLGRTDITWDDADSIGIAECARRTIGIAR